MDRKSAINVLADRIAAEQASHPLRVAIDGRTASGKTTLADEIAMVLHIKGRTVIRTSVDGFHRPRTERYRQGRFSAEGYLDDARDWTAVRHLLLDPLGPGATCPTERPVSTWTWMSRLPRMRYGRILMRS